jgi:class 3 adenylate cyclase
VKFSDIVDAAKALLQKKARITHRALAREFALDAAALQDLVDELVLAERVAVDEDGKVLVWAGPAADTTAPPAPTPEGDRRQLSVMFCDLVGSTALSEQLDPEDLHELVTAYQQAVLRVVQRYEGHIAQYLGDGILAYFGYPAAHEDDAVRAVRAGLDILAEIAQLAVTPPVQVRLGVHTGPVVIGAVGEGGRTEQLALGKTPNIAARVQSAAQPQALTISGATHRLVQGLFDCQDLGAHTLKGIAEPVALYQVMQSASSSTRFDVQLQQGLTPMQGRGHELAQLLQRWQLAHGGQGQVALLSGDAGIGKSRLVQALGQAAGEQGAQRLSLRCSPFYANSPLYPVVDLLTRLAQIGTDDGASARIRRSRRRYSSMESDLPQLV